MKQWVVNMRLEFDTTVTVEAETHDEALEKAQKADWVDDGLNGASMCNWEVTGRVREDGDV